TLGGSPLLESTRTVVRVAPLLLPLPPGVTYTNVVKTNLADESGNLWVSTNGAAVPAQGIAFTYKTASLLSVSPVSGAVFFAGQSVPASVSFEQGLGADSFEFTLNSNAPVVVPISAVDTSAATTLALASDAVEGRLRIKALKQGQSPFNLPEI